MIYKMPYDDYAGEETRLNCYYQDCKVFENFIWAYRERILHELKLLRIKPLNKTGVKNMSKIIKDKVSLLQFIAVMLNLFCSLGFMFLTFNDSYLFIFPSLFLFIIWSWMMYEVFYLRLGTLND